MLDYIFFHDSVCQKLCDYLRQLDVEYETVSEEGVITVSHSDELPDDVLEKIESYYDQLFDEESNIINTPSALASDAGEKDLVGVGTELSDGRLIQVRLPADTARRLLTAFSTEEVRQLVNEIAKQVEDPIDAPLCKDL